MRLIRTLGLLGIAAMLSAAVNAADVTVPMDQQINTGLTSPQSPTGNAIYTLNTLPNGGPSVQFSWGNDGDGGYTRATMPGNANANPDLKTGWYYVYLDPILAGLGPVDLSAPGSTLSFDTRFFQHPQTNSNPYGDAPVFLRLYNYADDLSTLLGYKDFGIVQSTQGGDAPYPDWTRVTVSMDDPGTVSGAWNPGAINRIRWYGTDWSGAGDDFVDFRNVTFSTPDVIPEPATVSLLAFGLAPLAARLRRRKA